MQIAATTRSLWDMSFPAACGQLQDLGFDKVEICLSEDSNQLKVSDLRDNVDAIVAQFRDSSRLSPVAILVEEKLEAERLDEFAVIVEFAKQLRVAQVTILASPVGTPFNSEIDRLRERNQMCEAEGIRLSILTRTGLLTEDPHTAMELCQSVKGLGITLDPSFYICGPGISFDVVYPNVTHLHLRDTSTSDLQVPTGLGEMDYNRIVTSLRQENYNRSMSVDLFPNTMIGEERLLEMRKLRRLIESHL